MSGARARLGSGFFPCTRLFRRSFSRSNRPRRRSRSYSQSAAPPFCQSPLPPFQFPIPALAETPQMTARDAFYRIYLLCTYYKLLSKAKAEEKSFKLQKMVSRTILLRLSIDYYTTFSI